MESDRSVKTDMPPNEPEAEIAVLGSMLQDGQAAADIFNRLDQSCFYDPKHIKIFHAGKSVFDRKEPVDILTVSSELTKKELIDDAGGAYYLTELIEKAQLTANYEHYCEMLLDAARRRKLIHLADTLKSKGKDQSTPLDIDAIRGQLDEIALDRTATAAAVCPTFADYEKEIQDEPDGIKSGFDALDKCATIPASALTVIAGRPSHGKTTFMLNMMMNQVRLNKDKMFFFFSYEQTFTQLMTLLLIRETEKVLDKDENFHKYWQYIRSKKTDDCDIEGARDRLRELTEAKRFWLMDDRYNIDQLTGRIRQLAGAFPIGAVFIDYVQKIGTVKKSYTRQTELKEISDKIQCMANDLKIPVIMGAQFNRDGEKRLTIPKTGKPGKPTKAERKKFITEDFIREAGDIEQDATLILGLWDDIKANGDDPNLTVTVLKSRYGATNKQIELKYDRELSTISDFDTNKGGVGSLYKDQPDF